MPGTILPFSSKQIELVFTLDSLFGRSGLSFSQNNSGEHLEETAAASKQKLLSDCIFRAVTLFRWHRWLFQFSFVQKIPDASLFSNSRVDPMQVIDFKVNAFEWSMMINSLLEKAFPVVPNIIHVIKGVSSVPWDGT